MTNLTYTHLIVKFHSITKADDIRDFEMEGMSVGNSLLDYFSETMIRNNKSSYTISIKNL